MYNNADSTLESRIKPLLKLYIFINDRATPAFFHYKFFPLVFLSKFLSAFS